MFELISIIVPVYNAALYLKDCIESILSQSYVQFELILVDDGSTDQSGTICDQYMQKDERVRVFHLQNGGVSAARNFGMKKALGNYFMFVDSDDEMEPGALHEVAQDFIQNADVYILGMKVVGNQGEEIIVPENGIFDESTFGDMYIELYKKFIINSPVNKVFKKSLISNNICFPINISLGEDLNFCNAYLRNCKKIVTLNKALYVYKQRDSGSLTTRYYENLFTIYQAHYWDVVKTIKHFNPQWDRTNCRELYVMYSWYIKQAINMVSHPQNKKNIIKKYMEVRKICKAELTKECVVHIKIKSIYDILLKKRWAIGLSFYLFASRVKNACRSGK